jgi:hypothetical protein
VLAEAVESRLEEWARWCRSCGRRRGSCGSIERNWRSPQHWEAITDVPPPQPIAWRAWQVELVVVALPDPHRWLLVAVYVWRENFAAIRRITRRRWNVREPAVLLAEARQRVADALARGDRRIGRAQIA